MCLLEVEGQNTFCYNTCNILYRSLSLMGMWETSPHVRESGIQESFACGIQEIQLKKS